MQERRTRFSYDFRVDLWALGIIVYQLLFEQMPFGLGDPNEDTFEVQPNQPSLTLHEWLLTSRFCWARRLATASSSSLSTIRRRTHAHSQPSHSCKAC